MSWNKPPPDAVQVNFDKLIRKKIEKLSQAVAICTRNCKITYSRLYGTGDSLTQHLISLGVGSETLVGLCRNKFEFAVLSILAVLRAGGAVVPLGAHLPAVWHEALVKDSPIYVVLVDMTQAKRFDPFVSRCIIVNANLSSSLLVPRGSKQPRLRLKKRLTKRLKKAAEQADNDRRDASLNELTQNEKDCAPHDEPVMEKSDRGNLRKTVANIISRRKRITDIENNS